MNDEPAKENSRSVTLPQGTIIKGKWKTSHKIGQGAFGETYAGYDITCQENQVAIKVERYDNKKIVLKLEVMALKKLQSCPHVVKYIGSGRQDEFNYLVMERLGENLAELRKKTPDGRFTLGTTLRLGIQMLEGIEGCHNLSYIHRDVKPSNFVIGSHDKRRRCFLIDFGLARKYRFQGGELRPPRKTAGFRGTARYASIHSHQSKELSRRDDLWSLFYMLVEFALGALPWRKVKDKDQIGELKEQHTNADLVKDLPNEFKLFMEHLQDLGYPTAPNYTFLKNLMTDLLEKEGLPMEGPFDWEDVTGNPQGLLSNGHNDNAHNDMGSPGVRRRLEPRNKSPERQTTSPRRPLAPHGNGNDNFDNIDNAPLPQDGRPLHDGAGHKYNNEHIRNDSADQKDKQKGHALQRRGSSEEAAGGHGDSSHEGEKGSVGEEGKEEHDRSSDHSAARGGGGVPRTSAARRKEGGSFGNGHNGNGNKPVEINNSHSQHNNHNSAPHTDSNKGHTASNDRAVQDTTTSEHKRKDGNKQTTPTPEDKPLSPNDNSQHNFDAKGNASPLPLAHTTASSAPTQTNPAITSIPNLTADTITQTRPTPKPSHHNSRGDDESRRNKGCKCTIM